MKTKTVNLYVATFTKTSGDDEWQVVAGNREENYADLVQQVRECESIEDTEDINDYIEMDSLQFCLIDEVNGYKVKLSK